MIIAINYLYLLCSFKEIRLIMLRISLVAKLETVGSAINDEPALQ